MAAATEDSSQAVKTEANINDDTKGQSSNAQPLAPPPKPNQQNSGEGPDYFSGSHGSNNPSHFSLEPNPFEQSFGNPSSGETPGKFAGLPSVASLTSPAPLGGNTPNWQNSLRSGPLSPAMLQGPANANSGYFDDSFRNSFPTPNESSLRTGLTPGGGGSMFPAPSPNSQAIFNLQGGGATPGTLEFQRTAMSAAARAKVENTNTQNGASNGQNMKQETQTSPQQQQAAVAQGAHENDAINSLYLLAQNGNRNAANNQFATTNQQQQTQNTEPQTKQQSQQGQENQLSSRNIAQQPANGGDFDDSDGMDETTPAGRPRGKKSGNTKGGPANGKRKKNDDSAQKGPAKKRSRESDASLGSFDMDEGSPELESPTHNSSGKKMTDDEKRKNFLERNRVAALKCRQRKKQWLANLQTKVEIFSSENDALSTQCSQLREEIIQLKTILVAHKDCPVSHQQGLGGQSMAQFIGEVPGHQNPYAMAAVSNGQNMVQMQGQGMQRS